METQILKWAKKHPNKYRFENLLKNYLPLITTDLRKQEFLNKTESVDKIKDLDKLEVLRKAYHDIPTLKAKNIHSFFVYDLCLTTYMAYVSEVHYTYDNFRNWININEFKNKNAADYVVMYDEINVHLQSAGIIKANSSIEVYNAKEITNIKNAYIKQLEAQRVKEKQVKYVTEFFKLVLKYKAEKAKIYDDLK